MRVIPIITLSLGPLGLLAAQGFSSGEQPKPTELTLPVAESDPRLDAIDQVIAEDPPAPGPVEIAPAPEFSLNLFARLPAPRPIAAPEPSSRTLTNPPEVSSDLINRIVNRSVSRAAEAIDPSRSSANSLVYPSQASQIAPTGQIAAQPTGFPVAQNLTVDPVQAEASSPETGEISQPFRLSGRPDLI
jgi:hypothetical protein